MSFPAARLRSLNDRALNPSGQFVLYWMTACRRTRFNYALERAAAEAERLERPLVVLEAVRTDYPWASARFHAFVIDGMADNAAALASTPVAYYPYVEPGVSAGRGLVDALAGKASLVVTDDYPAFFLARMTAKVAARLPVRVEAVDSNGLLPLSASGRAFATAYAFRRFLQRNLREHLSCFPAADPLGGRSVPEGRVPADIAKRWPAASSTLLARGRDLSALPIDHEVAPSPVRGGAAAAGERLASFLRDALDLYHEQRSHPDADAASGLSPYLHFGHLSVHQVFADLMTREHWTMRRLSTTASGQREGWWGASPAAESFLDEVVTWREVGLHESRYTPGYDHYDSLPTWARATLERHASDPRPVVYTRAGLEASATYDALWNAAQRQLVREGRLQNYLRMLWGKKVLEWSASPREALDTLVHLNNKYALDGRDPNSYSGIFWVFGRYDRPWAPERPIFGTVRYMSSENTARKLRLKQYLRTYGEERTLFG